jgi:hypothetical protein
VGVKLRPRAKPAKGLEAKRKAYAENAKTVLKSGAGYARERAPERARKP